MSLQIGVSEKIAEKDVCMIEHVISEETIKHFKGEGACCGGASSKPKKKKLNGSILQTYAISIEGMHCQNCVNAVTRAINDIDGASAKVNLKKKTAKVICDREIDISVIKEAIKKHGYEVQGGNNDKETFIRDCSQV